MLAGLREVQEQVDKELWEARQAQASADDEDAEIARLLAELEGLDAEKVRLVDATPRAEDCGAECR